ncbi:hypothetical protein BCT40_10445 [Vibrio lentus]|uniref:hypothetical protein n=1 Tax=Vibrio lentus TaxID=136468 RepID=UPI000C85471F|nr:hypothetical protein [Vibrio lentus]PMG54159.1 hypothetical protein BCU87_24830 [Vibrio lentus]PMM97700.1 hypothetical protein BCT40_10445 [Vibrio lentus]
MKPMIDLEKPLVKKGVDIYKNQVEKALLYTINLERAVVPIYWTLKTETKPEQVGSGVIVELGGEYFIFSASHVFDDIKQFQLLIGVGNGERLVSLGGERFSSAKGPSGTHKDDPIDASVFHIMSGITESVKERALTEKNLDLGGLDDCKSVFVACGFRVKKSNTDGNQANAKQECFTSLEYDEADYGNVGVERKMHLALAYEAQRLLNGAWNKSPKPQGISGGGIFKVDGVSFLPSFPDKHEPSGKLTAITIAHKQEKGGNPGSLIGTRIGVHLGLIYQFLPEALESIVS